MIFALVVVGDSHFVSASYETLKVSIRSIHHGLNISLALFINQVIVTQYCLPFVSNFDCMVLNSELYAKPLGRLNIPLG